MDLWYMITYPFALIINAIYFVIPNYGVAIILFTIVVKAALWPLTAKQQKSTMEMQKIQPALKELQAKYKNDKEKLNQEMMKLYQEHNINPMAGCLPMLIQLPLIIAVYQVISNPLTYMMSFAADKVEQMTQMLRDAAILAADAAHVSQIEIMNHFSTAHMTIEGFKDINFWFCGLNLAQTPMNVLGEWQTNFLWIIPIISLATAFWSSKTMTQASTGVAADPNTASTQKTMMMMMPLMSGYFTLILPAGVGLYWIVSNLAQVAQQLMVTKQKEKASGVIDVTPKKGKNKQ